MNETLTLIGSRYFSADFGHRGVKKYPHCDSNDSYDKLRFSSIKLKKLFIEGTDIIVFIYGAQAIADVIVYCVVMYADILETVLKYHKSYSSNIYV